MDTPNARIEGSDALDPHGHFLVIRLKIDTLDNDNFLTFLAIIVKVIQCQSLQS